MRLTTKATIWMLSLSFLLALNFGLGFLALRELQITDRITNQHYEVSHWVRRTETALSHFEINGLRSQSQGIESSRIELEDALRPVLDPDVVQAELRTRYRDLKSRIREFLQQSSDDPAIFSKQAALAELESIRSELQDLSFESEALVRADQALNEGLFGGIYPMLWTVFLLSLLAVVWRYVHFKRNVITPVHGLVDLIESYRKGDLHARWGMERPDEIGDAGRTMNQLLSELSQRRRERINFIGEVAHDIKNPLTAIAMGCDLILKTKSGDLDPKTRAVLDRMKAQVARLHHLTEDLLVAAKENRPAWLNRNRRFSLKEVASSAVETARTGDPKHVYTIHVVQQESSIIADPERITQVLMNLISNAAKYSPPGTEIDVELGHTNDSWYIEVKDRGVGIPDDKKASVFQAFNRLSSGMRMSSGTGLGLVIAKDIVESYSGRIRILDREGGGTCFRVELPESSCGADALPPTRAVS